ncbi:MAG: CDP-diacylglycerol--glycerol-3-phosphate 3-phosphatidyltransferase [Deltaproteobacteria bacterium]|nr:CDP-diacylglycerol--glycerol-3-phosphate 3-phosphatidyltransferase [Deltaproteobacteria bacterium]
MQSQSQAGNVNLPNVLSFVRIAAAPALVVMLLFAPSQTMSIVTAAVFSAVCATDWLDGYLARKRASVTALGQFLDPVADKILITTVLIMLIPLGRVPAWMIAVIISREIAVTGLRAAASNAGLVIPASNLGKYKTFAQVSSITALLIHYEFFGIDFHLVGMALFAAAFILTVWSGLDYFIGFFRAYLSPRA